MREPMKLKTIFTNVRVLILIAFIILAIIAINPRPGAEGVAIRSIEKNSSAALAGMQNPTATTSPTSRERIIAVNTEPITSIAQYWAAVKDYPPNQTITIETNKGTYPLTTLPLQHFVPDPEPRQNQPEGTRTTTQTATANTTESDQTNSSSNETLMPPGTWVVNGTQDLGIVVYDAPTSNLKLGLDLSGGTRVILKPKERVSSDDLNLIIENIKQRLNVFGLSDIIVRSAKDLSGDDFIIVEIAGANKAEVQELLSKQGKFEARIGNDTVFRGGQDITSVCRTAECSGITWNPQSGGCGGSMAGDGYVCRFSFQITLSPEAADRQADLTRSLAVITDPQGGGSYLSQPLALRLDDEQVDELQISSELKGRASTTIVISGSGAGTTQSEAQADAVTNMKRLQTVLITGSLPVQLEIVKSDGISPALGSEFIKNAVLLGILSIIAVTLVLVIRYRRAIIAVPIIITMLAEVTIVLGFAGWVGWNLDLASIAAIIIAIGSGVDDQIVIIDEALYGGVDRSTSRSWKDRIATAFFIVFASYFTLTSAMIPLWFAGAGLLRGFALTTIVGLTAGVLITRPAFASITEFLVKKDDEDE